VAWIVVFRTDLHVTDRGFGIQEVPEVIRHEIQDFIGEQGGCPERRDAASAPIGPLVARRW